MKLHANARLSVKGRELLIDRILTRGWSLTQAAEAAGVSDRTALKWVARFRSEGEQGLFDRSSAPNGSPTRTSDERVQVIAALRRLRMTGAEIAECLDMALTTVSGILTRIGMGKLGRLGLEPAVRYERGVPGELIHVDVKKLGRIPPGGGWRAHGRGNVVHHDRTNVGYAFVHSAVDGYSRVAYTEVLDDERGAVLMQACGADGGGHGTRFSRRSIVYYWPHDIEASPDIAGAVAYIVTRPWRMSVNEILIRPTEQDS